MKDDSFKCKAKMLLGILKTEDCQILSSCIDTVCNHHTNLECVHGICTCSPPPYNIRKLKRNPLLNGFLISYWFYTILKIIERYRLLLVIFEN